MRVAKVDGHISTLTLPNMVTLFPKNVLHIKLLLLSPHAVSIVLVPQSPKLKVLTNSEVPMVIQRIGEGQTSEKRMMKEILRNGALNTEF